MNILETHENIQQRNRSKQRKKTYNEPSTHNKIDRTEEKVSELQDRLKLKKETN